MMEDMNDMGAIADAAADAMQRAVGKWLELITTVAAGGIPSREARGAAIVEIHNAQQQLRTLADALSWFALQCDAVVSDMIGEVKQ